MMMIANAKDQLKQWLDRKRRGEGSDEEGEDAAESKHKGAVGFRVAGTMRAIAASVRAHRRAKAMLQVAHRNLWG